MMWARIDGGVVAETTTMDPAGRFHPSLVWAACDATVKQGYVATLANGDRAREGGDRAREGGDRAREGGAWAYSAPPPPAPPVPPPPVQISPLAFIGRFTAGEQSAIATAAMGNVPLWLWFNKMTAATTIDLSDAETRAGLDALVSAGLITAARETAILTP